MKWNLITLILNSAHISPILNHEITFISFCHPVKPFPGLPSVTRVWVTYAADLFVLISPGTKNGIKYPLIYVCRKISRHYQEDSALWSLLTQLECTTNHLTVMSTLQTQVIKWCKHNVACFLNHVHLCLTTVIQTETCTIVEYDHLLSLMVHTNYGQFTISTTE